MVKAFADFNGLGMFFLVCAAAGGFFVFVKLILQFAGGDADTNGGLDGDIDGEHADSDLGFRLLSMHGLSAFFMMFGLVGLALYRQNQMSVLLSILGAVCAGMVSVWVIGRLFRGAAALQANGALKTRDAVGSAGTVYLTIPRGGMGMVSINFQNRLREFDAMETNGLEVPTGTPVRVVKVNANVLVVETIK